MLFINNTKLNYSGSLGSNMVLNYDKQGGPRSEDVTTMLFAEAVGTTSNSQSRVVMIGLYSKNSASVATKSSA